MGKRLVLLNALPLSMFSSYTAVKLMLKRLKPDELSALKTSQFSEVVCYIRHPSTVRAVSELIGVELEPSAGLYTYRPGDTIVVVTLRKPVRGQEVEVKLEDLEFWLVMVEEVA